MCLSRKELDRAAGNTVFLFPACCYAGELVKARYDKHTGEVILTCPECGKPVAHICVAEENPAAE